MKEDTTFRSLAKAVTYRGFMLICDMGVVYWFTGSTSIAAGIGIFNVGYKFMLYERIWAWVKWGRSEMSDPNFVLVDNKIKMSVGGNSYPKKKGDLFYIVSDYEPIVYEYEFDGEYCATSKETGWFNYVVIPVVVIHETPIRA